ncbi:helix-turn-helix domain-containing protein [Leptospira stimsonii]|uniref:HTH araC/xylS-type domain-containing protein n=1 Tax=Leptospira stimsonii TaxID=2202203 RepID=A0A8B3CMC8_9LEPT|nr:helix-turn-helix domain-containing protein [Leptospira stimsonii]RHX83783.1 hypothetical protein DLM78_20025 [Leptospira stimsonii]
MISVRTAPGLIIIYFYIIEYNFPIFLQKEITENFTELEPGEYSDKTHLTGNSRNLLEGVNLDKIEENVNQFLTNREYLDEEIRLPDFSAYIGLSTHQASYYLNHYRKLSFSDFLNYHRLEEAKQLILSKKNLNLLEIAFECGFNSPSSFRRACLKFAEKTPKELRNQLIQEEPTLQKLELQTQS